MCFGQPSDSNMHCLKMRLKYPNLRDRRAYIECRDLLFCAAVIGWVRGWYADVVRMESVGRISHELKRIGDVAVESEG